MNLQRLSLAAALALAAAASTATLAAQSRPAARGTAAPAAAYNAPKTPWGDPDLQGIYTNKDENGIPLERPGNLNKQVDEVDDAELADIIKERNERAEKAAAGIGGAETGAGPTHWYEHYGAQNSRAWMLVD